MMTFSKKIEVKGVQVLVIPNLEENFISLTDIARFKDPVRSDYILQNWMRTKATVEFVGLWERLNNPNFNSIEFDGIKNEAGANSFTLTPKKWINLTNAIGILSKAGRYGGTFAHPDIAFEFATWISAEFKLLLIKEYQHLKEEELRRLDTNWNMSRFFSKINYKIHTEAIKENLVPKNLSLKEIGTIYASEADLLNMAVFGETAASWKSKFPGIKSNMREKATIEQLVVLANLEALNALLIQQGLAQSERLKLLNQQAIKQMKTLLKVPALRQLK